ncbi:hypothetical protein DY000_02000510 [Brassica cretica]|uniref:Uncharacterized protein n=1 Tax=Brassica cretica TaxID=69181 RepID=A0ABQ7C6K4_BRACR|nr:hypothetical protein DY000_02000510 [Brassica cretica]
MASVFTDSSDRFFGFKRLSFSFKERPFITQEHTMFKVMYLSICLSLTSNWTDQSSALSKLFKHTQNPETVKVVLAKRQSLGQVWKHHHLLQQQIEFGNYSPCSSPSGIDPREQSDFQLDSKMFYERREMMRRKMEQADLERAIEFERRRVINLQLPEFKNSVVPPNHQGSFSVGSPGCFSSASNQSSGIQSELNSAADAFEVVDDATVVHPYSVTDSRSVNKNNYSNRAVEGTNESETLEPDTGRTIELVLPSNLFPSATCTDDSAETNAEAGVSASSSNGNDHEPPATTSSLMQ